MSRQEFTQAVLQHKERLWGYALQLTRHQTEAEDLLQLTYLRAFERWEQLRDLDRACGWLIRTMHRAFVDRYRRQRRAPHESLSSDEGTQEHLLPMVNVLGAQTEARDLITKALPELAPALSQALMLRDVWGFSYEEIAELMECPIGTVRSRIARARAQMLQVFKSQTSSTERQGKEELL